MTLGEQLDEAKYVRHDPLAELTLAWFGGHGIHAYTADGDEVSFWNLSGPEDPSLEAVQRSMVDTIANGEYP